MGLYKSIYSDAIPLERYALDGLLVVFLLCGMPTNLYRGRDEYPVYFKRCSFLLGRENVYLDNDCDGNERGVSCRFSDYQLDAEKLGNAE